MLDVHPAHHAASTWKDFFIHIATIVVGLIIAVGLEQSVEVIHHAHQSSELREALLTDAEIAVQQTSDVHAYAEARATWLSLRIDQVREALATGHPLPPEPPRSGVFPTVPDDPAWKAAKGSERSELLTQEEIKIYNDVDFDVDESQRAIQINNDDDHKLIQFGYKFTRAGERDPDLSILSPQDLREYLDLLAASKMAARVFGSKCRELHNAEAAILHGETTLRAVQGAEQKSW